MIEASPLIPHTEKGMVIDIIIASIDPTELTDDVLFFPGINVVRAHQTECLAEPANGLPVLWRAENSVANALHAGWPGGEPDDLTRAVQRLDTRIDRLPHH